MKKIVLTIIFFYSTLANSALKEELQTQLETAWNKDYIALTCSDNSAKLYERIKLQKINFDKASILHIRHRHLPYASIFGKKQRLKNGDSIYKPIEWVFHAILLIDGFVLDLDFSDTPTVIPLKKYMETMWDQDELQHNYRFQVKAAELYHKYDYDGLMNDQEVLTYDQLLKRPSFEGLSNL